MNTLINQPGQGAVHMPSRYEAKKYVHQAYPSTRFHPDGRDMTVASEEDDATRCPAAEGWRNKPYPPKPVTASKPEPTLAELKADLAEKIWAFNRSWGDLTLEHENLKTAYASQQKLLEEAVQYSVEQGNEILDLQRRLHVLILADTAKSETPAPETAKKGKTAAKSE